MDSHGDYNSCIEDRRIISNRVTLDVPDTKHPTADHAADTRQCPDTRPRTLLPRHPTTYPTLDTRHPTPDTPIGSIGWEAFEYGVAMGCHPQRPVQLGGLLLHSTQCLIQRRSCRWRAMTGMSADGSGDLCSFPLVLVWWHPSLSLPV